MSSQFQHEGRDDIEFDEELMFSGSNCDIDGIGHDEENAKYAYDFKGQVFAICPRPWCGQVFKTIAADDLTSVEFDNLQHMIRSIATTFYEDD